MPQGFGARTYQQWSRAGDLQSFRVTIEETELLILAESDLSEIATQEVRQYREQIIQYIQQHPEFHTSFTPIAVDEHAPPIIQKMASAAKLAGVGPFAAVAGAIAEYVGKALLEHSSEVIVENGGDIFIASARDRILGIYAGKSSFTGTLGLKVTASHMPCGVCTSSGSVGPSVSYGRADAAIVLSKSTMLADACATALGNTITTPLDLQKGINFVKNIEGVDGAVVILGNDIGAWGDVEFVRTNTLKATL